MNISELKAQILSESKGNLISVLGEEPDKPWLVSPALDLNRILSGSLNKSIQAGTHTGLVGPEMCGKSSLMALFLADAQKKGFLPVVIDAEGAWDKAFVIRWGISPENLLRIPTLWIDDIMVELSKIIDKKYQRLAIVVDSIGALELKKVVTDGVDKGDVKADQGRLQKDIKRMLKMIIGITKFSDSVAFSAGHFYGNPTGYGNPEKLGGGKYFPLSCDTLISLKKSPIYENPMEKTIAKKGKILGNSIRAATLKNRKYPPFLEATVEIDFKNGVNDIAGLIDVAIDMGLITKGGAGWYTFEKLDIKSQGLENLNKDLISKKDEFLILIEDYLKTTGYSNINTSLELALQENIESIEPEIPEVEEEKTSKKIKNKKGK